jgi:ATP-binding cassette subfamily F protein uup
MNYLTLENVSKSYGEKVLFENLTMYLNRGEKVALIAKNGAGKSSLLHIITGQSSAEGEHQSVFLHPNIRMGYLEQDPIFEPDISVLDSVFDSKNPAISAIREYEYLVLTDAPVEKLQPIIDEIESLKAWDTEARIKEILSSLKIHDFDAPVGTLSGGQKKRLALAKVLIDEPDFLVLDEPTNHLDLEMIEWLEKFLQQPNLTLLLITHDRYFLENVCQNIFELEHGQLSKYTGNYSSYLEKKAEKEQNDATRLWKNKQLMKQELEWMRRMPKARTTKAKSRISKFSDLRAELSSVQKDQQMKIQVEPARIGKKIIELQYISKRFDEKIILKDFHYKFNSLDRVGIIGANGAGKSTLLNMVTGLIPPDAGKVVIGETVKVGYYTQDGMQLKQDKRVIDVARDVAEYIPAKGGQKLTAGALLEMFMFSRSQQQVYVSQISGGEKRRLYLLTILMQNPNFLILDEPTNDLDIHTLNVLEDYLTDWPGCLLIASHDRFFMDKLVDHLFVMDGNGGVRDYPGNYTQYRSENRQLWKPDKNTSDTSSEKVVKSDFTLSKERKNAIKKIERKINNLEKEKTLIMSKFETGAIHQDEIVNLSKRLKEVESEIEEMEMEWMELVE